MIFATGIHWYAKPEGKTAHLFTASRHSWCGAVHIPPLEDPWHTCANNTGFKLCKNCLKSAKRQLGIKP